MIISFTSNDNTLDGLHIIPRMMRGWFGTMKEARKERRRRACERASERERERVCVVRREGNEEEEEKNKGDEGKKEGCVVGRRFGLGLSYWLAGLGRLLFAYHLAHGPTADRSAATIHSSSLRTRHHLAAGAWPGLIVVLPLILSSSAAGCLAFFALSFSHLSFLWPLPVASCSPLPPRLLHMKTELARKPSE